MSLSKLKIIVVFTIFILFSCENDNAITENQISKTLIFQKINTNSEMESRLVISNQGKFIFVGCDEWGRKKKDCRGWGLCNAQWFYNEDDRIQSTTSNGFSSPLQYNENTQEYYLEILLAKETNISNDLLTLNIDEDIILNTESVIGKDLIFKSGSYYFDNTLSQFGGYRITLM